MAEDIDTDDQWLYGDVNENSQQPDEHSETKDDKEVEEKQKDEAEAPKENVSACNITSL